MAWVAEILRKQHRECARCRMGPTHLYDPDLTELADEATVSGKPPETGTPLCNGCLLGRLETDLAAFTGRCLLFEPSLGPESILFVPFETDEPADEDAALAAARSALSPLPRDCVSCRGTGRFLWVPVELDANLWSTDWLPMLAEGALTPTATLCGRCAAGRLVRTLEQRGLTCEVVVPPRGAVDGAMFGSEV